MIKMCWNITNKCNKDCKYCFRCLEKKELPLDENVKILHSLKEKNIEKITWSGGEPTLYEGIESLLRLSKELKYKNNMITNASQLTPEKMDALIPFLDEITFSVDFIDDELNEKYGRGKHYYQIIKEKIAEINSKYPHCAVKINTIIMKANLDHIEDIYKEIQKIKISRWKILQFSPIRGIAIENQNRFIIDDVTYKNVISKFQNGTHSFEFETHDYEYMKNKKMLILPDGTMI